MKRILITISAMALLATMSCSKSNDDGGETPTPAVEEVNTFGMTIDDVFNNPVKNLTNIQVGDYIPYTLEITDTQDNASVYSLILVKEGEKNHQTLGRDYEIYIDNEKGEKQKMEILKNDATNYVLFNKKGKYYFYIKPLVAGTFKQVYELQKQVDGKPVGDHIKQEVLFNVVRIKVWFESEETQSSHMFRHSKHKNNFYFSIDDGMQQDDTHLTSQNGIIQKYYIEYDGGKYEGDLNQGNIKFTESHEQKKSAPEVRNRTIDKIIIKQIMPNGRQTEIKYYNINF